MSTPKRLARMAEEVDLNLKAVRQVLRQPVEAEFAHGELTGPQRSVMHVVVQSGGVSLKDLSKQIGLAHSTVSGIVDRLEKQGLLERKTDASDGRISLITASKVVRDYLRDTLPGLTIHPLVEALRRAKPAERKTILEGLRTLRRVVENR
jgi:DNA-binding MarR family transcriptional regulator